MHIFLSINLILTLQLKSLPTCYHLSQMLLIVHDSSGLEPYPDLAYVHCK